MLSDQKGVHPGIGVSQRVSPSLSPLSSTSGRSGSSPHPLSSVFDGHFSRDICSEDPVVEGVRRAQDVAFEETIVNETVISFPEIFVARRYSRA